MFYTPSPEPDVLEVRRVDMAELKLGRALTFMMSKSEFLSRPCLCTEDLLLILCKRTMLMQAAVKSASRKFSGCTGCSFAAACFSTSRRCSRFLVWTLCPCDPCHTGVQKFSCHRRSALQFVVRPGQDDIDNLHRLLEEKQEPCTIMNPSL